MMGKKCCKKKSKKDNLVVDEPEIVSNHLPAKNCCFTINNKLKTTVINVYLNRSEIHQENKEFGSVYLKCAACLAVSKQVFVTNCQKFDICIFLYHIELQISLLLTVYCSEWKHL